MRSTSPGRLSSSQDFSIGRSISLTRSSSVRALLLSTVLARRVEGGFDRRHGRARQNLLRRRRRRRFRTAAARMRAADAPVWRRRFRRIRDRPPARPCGTAAAAADPAAPSRRSVRTPRRQAAAAVSRPPRSPHRGRPASRRCRPGCWTRPARGWRRGGAAARRLGGSRLRGGNGRRRNVVHHGRLGCRRRARLFRLRRRRRGAGGLFGGRRLCFIVGDDAPDRRQNLLHRGFLDLCRLRHLRLHIINAFACVLHQAQTGFAGSGYAGRDFHRTSLTCPQIKRRSTHRAGSRPCSGHRSVAADQDARCGANRSAASSNGTSWQQLIASKAPWRVRQTAHQAPQRSTSAISGRRACERRTSCRAPADNARSDRRSWSAA